DFFALGGDSFLTLELAAQAKARGMYLAPAAIYEHPHLASLARHLSSQSIAMSAGSLRAEVASLSLRPAGGQIAHPEKRQVLMTGATGFLGARVFRPLLDRPDIHRVHCLVRNGQRARWSDPRAIAIDGDLTKPSLGLRSHVLCELAASI